MSVKKIIAKAPTPRQDPSISDLKTYLQKKKREREKNLGTLGTLPPIAASYYPRHTTPKPTASKEEKMFLRFQMGKTIFGGREKSNALYSS